MPTDSISVKREGKRRFPAGRLVITSNAASTLPLKDITTALLRHLSGDWGDVGQEDHTSNEEALKNGFRLFSVYRSSVGIKFWIITEANRSSTCILLPEDY